MSLTACVSAADKLYPRINYLHICGHLIEITDPDEECKATVYSLDKVAEHLEQPRVDDGDIFPPAHLCTTVPTQETVERKNQGVTPLTLLLRRMPTRNDKNADDPCTAGVEIVADMLG